MPSLVFALVLALGIQDVQPAAADHAAHARDVLAALASQDFGRIEAQFTDQMKAALPPGRLEGTWKTVLTQAGAYKSCAGEPRVRSIADKVMVITACQFEHGGVDVQVAFDAAGKIAGMALRPAAAAAPYTPPAYANAASYSEEELTLGGADWPLPGTLTLPAGAGPFPVVILVHGSGPNDRDESLGPNKPFKDLALGLASRGIAVLRYDKRSKVHGARMAASAAMTVKEEVVDDVGEAVQVLRTRTRIDPSRIFVLGHSLGAMLIPRIAAANPGIAGAIVLAGPARPVEEAIVEQTRYLALLDGTIAPEEQAQIDAAAKNSAAIKALGAADAAAGVRFLNTPAGYWLDLRGYDAPAAAKAVKVRMLVLQGERDYQVTAAEFARWKSALADRPDVTFHSYPALNHLFMAGTGPATPQDYQTASHVADDVIRDIAAWIQSPPAR